MLNNENKASYIKLTNICQQNDKNKGKEETINNKKMNFQIDDNIFQMTNIKEKDIKTKTNNKKKKKNKKGTDFIEYAKDQGIEFNLQYENISSVDTTFKQNNLNNNIKQMSSSNDHLINSNKQQQLFQNQNNKSTQKENNERKQDSNMNNHQRNENNQMVILTNVNNGHSNGNTVSFVNPISQQKIPILNKKNNICNGQNKQNEKEQMNYNSSLQFQNQLLYEQQLLQQNNYLLFQQQQQPPWNFPYQEIQQIDNSAMFVNTIEYLFSFENIQQDQVLCSIMTQDGFVALPKLSLHPLFHNLLISRETVQELFNKIDDSDLEIRETNEGILFLRNKHWNTFMQSKMQQVSHYNEMQRVETPKSNSKTNGNFLKENINHQQQQLLLKYQQQQQYIQQQFYNHLQLQQQRQLQEKEQEQNNQHNPLQKLKYNKNNMMMIKGPFGQY